MSVDIDYGRFGMGSGKHYVLFKFIQFDFM